MYKFAFLCAVLLFYFPLSENKKELPSYLKICHRYDPHLSDCIKGTLEILKPHLGKGIPEMRIAPFDPLHVTKLVLDDSSVHFEYEDLDFYMMNDFDVAMANFSYDKCIAYLDVRHPSLALEGRYNAKGRLLVFELEGEGLIYTNFTNVRMWANMNCTREMRKGEEYANFTDIDFKIEIGGYHVKLTDLFKNNPDLTERTNAVFNENSDTLLAEFQPILAKAVQQIFLSTVQNVFDRFPLDVLLPE